MSTDGVKVRAAADADHARARAPAAGRTGDRAGPRPRPAASHAALLALQRGAGNAAVARALGAGAAARAADGETPSSAAGPQALPGVTTPGSTATPDARGTALDAGRPAPPPRAPGPVGAGPAPVLQRGVWDTVAGAADAAAAGLRTEVLGTIGRWAREIPGYGVLCVALGRDPVTGRTVPRDATTVVGALVGLVPGGHALWENLQQSGAVERAGAWVAQELDRLGLTWDAVRGVFARAWDAVSASDLLDPAGLWERLAGILEGPVARLRAFASAAGSKLMELVVEGVMSSAGGFGAQVMGVLRGAGDVLGTIVRDPVAFAGNLVGAVRTGLGQFAGNILGHLRTGLIGWLTGALRGAVQLPARLDLGGMLSLVTSLLGLTWEGIRQRVVRLVGEPVVHAVETTVDWVRTLVERGVGGIVDRLRDMVSGLLDTVLGGIRDWVARTVVGAAITRLVSMFNPAGAVIQAILAVYNTVQFALERAQQLAAFAQSVVGSVSAIARGSIGAAADAVEQSLARAVPVVLGFLARLIGLGDVAAPVRAVIERVRGVVDGVVDRVVGWVAALARRVGGAVRGRGGTAAAGQAAGAAPGEQATPDGKQVAVASAITAVEEVAAAGGGTPAVVRALPGIKARFGLASLVAEQAPEGLSVTATINPTSTKVVPPTLLPGQLRPPPTAPWGAARGSVDAAMLTRAVGYRAGTALDLASFRTNFAVFRIRHNGTVTYLQSANDPGALHSEARLLQQLEALAGPRWYLNKAVVIEQVYTERMPCSSCGPHLRNVERAQLRVDPASAISVFYSVLSTTRPDQRASELMAKYGP
ncbi:hypothetical protein OMK64_10830 [Cellulomonas fimi]|uniref:nucleic acid/nucleotide deaminase domain-containing protein n=1 Tax=Cellulomonas fimi TaxID=1708 RepID=UPI00234D377E|nr:nucleic acid/nucleotide deaminase domain-containing protein [Cellulomonas fimi]MDC7122031.1 hypothetical protein [Cellulomonas fimi]